MSTKRFPTILEYNGALLFALTITENAYAGNNPHSDTAHEGLLLRPPRGTAHPLCYE